MMHYVFFINMHKYHKKIFAINDYFSKFSKKYKFIYSNSMSKCMTIKKKSKKKNDFCLLPFYSIYKLLFYQQALKELGALDEEASLTEKGNRIGSFVSLFPFVSKSINTARTSCRPSIPLGQYLLCLISEPKLNSVA